MQLSKNLHLRECLHSDTAKRLGIDNYPMKEEIENLEEIARNVFQPLRDHFGVPIFVSSGYRSKAVNKAIGGSTTSQHCKGQALDLDADKYGKITNADIFNFIKDNLQFDQLIWEFGDEKNPAWVHVSYNGNVNCNRGAILVAYKEGKKTKYRNFH